MDAPHGRSDATDLDDDDNLGPNDADRSGGATTTIPSDRRVTTTVQTGPGVTTTTVRVATVDPVTTSASSGSGGATGSGGTSGTSGLPITGRSSFTALVALVITAIGVAAVWTARRRESVQAPTAGTCTALGWLSARSRRLAGQPVGVLSEGAAADVSRVVGPAQAVMELRKKNADLAEGGIHLGGDGLEAGDHAVAERVDGI